jgi:FkbM family methyltransferase
MKLDAMLFKDSIKFKSFLYTLIGATFFRTGISKKINGAKIVFPFRFSRYYPGDYEPSKQKFIEDYASGLAVDLGAHIGLYTVLLSRKATQVIAFEPTEFTREVLSETVRFNGCNNVEIRSEVITDTSGQITFYETNDNISNANSIIPLGSPITLNTLSIDDLNRKIDFLKIDIEGAELVALKGAQKTLLTLKFMTLEIHPKLLNQLGSDVSDIFNLLAPLNPKYYFEGTLVSADYLCSIDDHFEINVFLNGANSKD